MLRIYFLLFFLLFVGKSNIFSQDTIKKHPILTDKFTFSAGLYGSSKSIRLKVNGATKGDLIDFNQAFNLNNNQITPFFNFNWRFANKWVLSAEYFGIRNGNKWELKEDVEWQDVVFKKGTNVKIGFGMDMYRVVVGRIFSQGDHHEFGVGLGAHTLNVSSFIEGNALINDNEFGFERVSVSVLAPLPNLALWYFYAPNDKWIFLAKVDWFAISIGDYFGGLWDIGPSVQYQVFKHWGVGLSYRYFNLAAKVNKSNWDGRFNLIYQGPMFSITGNF